MQMLLRGRRGGFLKGVGVEGQFLGRKGGKEWQQGKIEERKAGERYLGGQIRTHMVRVSRSLGPFEVVRRRQRLGRQRVIQR